MVIYKHKDWETFSGTWFIASSKLSDADITAMILSSPKKYGYIADWQKIK